MEDNNYYSSSNRAENMSNSASTSKLHSIIPWGDTTCILVGEKTKYLCFHCYDAYNDKTTHAPKPRVQKCVGRHLDTCIYRTDEVLREKAIKAKQIK